jgi:hypothetical protein
MPVRVLEVDLPNPICPNGNVLRLTGEADISHPILLQARERRLEVSGRKSHMGGEWTGSLRFRVAANQVEGPEAVDDEPSDVALANPVRDFRKAKDGSVEEGTGIHIPNIQRDMMQGEKVGHGQVPVPKSSEGHRRSITAIARHHHVTHGGPK